MPNYQGGKKYKSTKHAETTGEMHEINQEEGQTIGRVIRNLGNRNVIVYCNDGKERMAHIRNGLKKKSACIEVGDIVLLSLRGEGMKLTSDSSSSSKDRGDILAKYERDTHNQLKKLPGVNLKLFNTLEGLDERTRAKGEVDDFGFTFEQGEQSEEEDGSSSDEKKERDLRKTTLEKKRSAARQAKLSGSGRQEGDESEASVNIDDI
jgi:translation initiation factor 1A